MLNYKSFLKSLVPFVGTLVAVGAQYLVTGEFDKAELATALTGLSASLIAFLVPNDTNADKVVDTTPVTATSDKRLG